MLSMGEPQDIVELLSHTCSATYSRKNRPEIIVEVSVGVTSSQTFLACYLSYAKIYAHELPMLTYLCLK